MGRSATGGNSMTRESQMRIAVFAIALTAIFAVAYVGKPILAPLALAFVTSIVLSPIQAGIRRLGLPQGPSAVLTFVTILLLLILSGLVMEPAASRIYTQAPFIKMELRAALEGVRETLGGISDFSNEMGEAISPSEEEGGAGGGEGDGEGEGEGDGDRVEMPGLADVLFLAPAIAAQFMVFAGGLFFFLLCREDMYRWTARMADAKTDDFRAADRMVAKYFTAITVINFGFGSIVAVVLYFMGLPYAPLWGAAAALMNYVLYLGPALFALILLVTGLILFDGVYAALPAISFVLLNMMEGQFVTPTLVGRHLQVNPLLIFLALCLLLWLWGPIGGIVAIPLLLWGQVLISALGLVGRQTRLVQAA